MYGCIHGWSLKDKHIWMGLSNPELRIPYNLEEILNLPYIVFKDGANINDSTDERVGAVGRLLVATPESEHDEIRLKICKALGSVKDKFNLLKNTSGDFSSWRYEFTDLGRFKNGSNICTSEDSGFLVFYFMLSWDGRKFSDTVKIPNVRLLLAAAIHVSFWLSSVIFLCVNTIVNHLIALSICCHTLP